MGRNIPAIDSPNPSVFVGGWACCAFVWTGNVFSFVNVTGRGRGLLTDPCKFERQRHSPTRRGVGLCVLQEKMGVIAAAQQRAGSAL